MLHRHVEALFDKRVFCVDVAARANDGLRATRVVNAAVALRTESLFARIEDDVVLQVLAPCLVHRLRSLAVWLLVGVQAWAGDIKLETLAVEDLIVVEAGGGCVEPDSLARYSFVVRRPHAVLLPDVGFFDAGDLVFDSENGILVIDVLPLLTLRHNSRSLSSHTLQDSAARVLRRISQFEAIRGRPEEDALHRSLLR